MFNIQFSMFNAQLMPPFIFQVCCSSKPFRGFGGLILHFFGSFYINRTMAAVEINYNGNCHCCLGRRNRNNKYGKENTVEFVRIQVFVEYDKIYVYTIQYQFY